MKIAPRAVTSVPSLPPTVAPQCAPRAANYTPELARPRDIKPLPTCPTLALVKAPSSVDVREQQALAAFARHAGVDHAEVARVMSKAQVDKLETAKAYVVLADAANGNVIGKRAEAIRGVMAAMRDGRIHVQKSELSNSDASYDHARNVLTVPADGMALDVEKDRATLVHEAEHIAQDMRMAAQSRYASEGEGHEAAADYVLHAAGALTEADYGTHIDIERGASAIATLQARGYSEADIVAANYLCARVAREAASRGDPIDLEGALAAFDRESFADIYKSLFKGKPTDGLSTIMVKQGL